MYAATLLKIFIISCRNFLVEILGTLILSSSNKDNLVSSFPVHIPLTTFTCFIALAKTSNTILNRYEGSIQLCLVPYLVELFRISLHLS